MDILQYASVIAGLTEVLEIKIVDARGSVNHYSKTYIGRAIKGVIEHNNIGDVKTSEIELFKLAFLLKHLREIRAANPIVFQRFRLALLRCMTPRDFYGVRMEVNVAASLVRTGRDWEKRESPDFKVLIEQPVFIECTSAHLSATKDRDVLYKIGSVITAKGKKPYANNETALFIDVTNLVFSHVSYQRSLERNRIYSCVSKSLADVEFGAVMLFSYIHNNDLSQFESSYWRIDNSSISSSLQVFLDQSYPISTHRVDSFTAIAQG